MSDSESAEESRLTRAAYTSQEDKFIIAYISKNKVYSRVKGSSLWENLAIEMQNKGYRRSWHSVKERFRKHIVPNINCYHLKQHEVDRLLLRFSESERKKIAKRKGSRQPYSSHEDRILIKSVLKERGDVKGNTLWKNLEKKEIIPGRTWESMRNRFLKTTLKNLSVLADKDICDKIKQRTLGKEDFVASSSDEKDVGNKKQRHLPFSKRLEKELHTSPLRRSPRHKKLKTLSCSDPAVSTSKTCSALSPTASKECLCPSSSASCKSSSPTLSSRSSNSWSKAMNFSINACKKKLFTLSSSDSAPKFSSRTCVHSTPKSIASNVPSSNMPLISQIPVVLLNRCCVKTPEEEVGMSSVEATSQWTDLSDSTIFDATTLRIMTGRECCCGDFVGSDKATKSFDKMTPCGSGCRILSREQERDKSPCSRTSLEWLCKPTDARQASANSSGIIEDIPGSGGRVATVKKELREEEVEQMIIYLNSEEERTCVSSQEEQISVSSEEQMNKSSEEDEDVFIDPLYADFMAEPSLYFGRKKGEDSLGPLPFPEVDPVGTEVQVP